MRGNPEDPRNEWRREASTRCSSCLAAEAGQWTPIAGGTELMVAHAAGRLPTSKLVSLWGIRDLRFIESRPDAITIGAGATFTDIRSHQHILADLPLLARAATWIGSIANQTRATLGGNLVNGSPAADSPPALLAYDAEVELTSVRGSRRIPYSDFHTGYKKNALAPDELLYAIHIPRRFTEHRQYLRTVGTRRDAMAIAKVALGANGPHRRTASSAKCALKARPAWPRFPPGSIAPKMRCAANVSTRPPSAPHAPPCSPRCFPSTTFVPPPNTAGAWRPISWMSFSPNCNARTRRHECRPCRLERGRRIERTGSHAGLLRRAPMGAGHGCSPPAKRHKEPSPGCR